MEELEYWHVVFDGEDPGPSDDFMLNFVDCSDLVGEPLLNNNFIDDLILHIKKHEHYNIIGNIKNISDDNDEDQSDKNIYALLGILKNGLKVGFLLGNIILEEKDLWHVAAIWPTDFALEVIKDQSVFQNALLLVIDDPDQWIRVDLITPITKKASTSNITI